MTDKGLVNQGNTCYINVIIQILYSFDELRNFIKSSECLKLLYLNILQENNDQAHALNSIKNTITYNLKLLYHNIEQSKKYYDPKDFLSKLVTRDEFFINEQQDTFEALLKFIDIINSEMYSESEQGLKHFFNYKYIKTTICTLCNNTKHKNEEDLSFNICITFLEKDIEYDLSKYFTFKIKDNDVIPHDMTNSEFTKLICEDLKKVLNNNIINNIITKENVKQSSDTVIDVHKELTKIIKDSEISVMTCDGCYKECEHTIAILPTHIPKILTIVINRFTFNKNNMKQYKLYNDLIIPDILSFDINDVSHLYSLSGIIVHFGNSVNSGHYVSYIKNDNLNIWSEYNDKKVKHGVDFLSIDKSSIYILFYKSIL